MATVRGKRLVVLGGGISGLSFLHYVRNFAAFFEKKPHISKMILLEANNYMGGSIKTKHFQDGMLHELGPRSIRLAGVRAHNTVALLEQLGLADKVLPIKGDSPAARNRYVYYKGRMNAIPTSMMALFKKIPGSDKRIYRSVLQDFSAEKMNLDQYPDRDPPFFDFVKHRFGQEIAEGFIDPLLRGITAGDARHLSTRALFGDWIEKEQTYGSVLKSMAKPPVTKMAHDPLFPQDVLGSKLLDKFDKDKVASYNLSTGLQTIPEYISNSLLNTNEDGAISIFNQTKVKSIEFNVEKDEFEIVPCMIEVETVDGDLVKIEADHVISAIPSKELMKLLPKNLPEKQKKAFDLVGSIPHSPVACVCVEFRDLQGPQLNILQSFGFLTQSTAGSKVLGIAMDTAMFPQIDRPFKSNRMTAMIGGSWFKEIFGTDNPDQVTDAQMEQIALEEIGKLLGIKQDPYAMSSLLWKVGIAQYKPGHKGYLREAREILKEQQVPITLIGQSYDGVAVNDVIFSSRMAAHEYVKSL